MTRNILGLLAVVSAAAQAQIYEITQLTDLPAGADVSAFIDYSRDGSTVVFKSDININNGNTDGGEEIFVIDTGSGTLTQITDSVVSSSTPVNPRLSGDGRWLVFSRDDFSIGSNPIDPDSEVYLFDRDSLTTTQITNIPNNSGPDTEPPQISDDGAYIVFTSDADLDNDPATAFDNTDGSAEIFLVERASGTITQITNLPSGSRAQSPSIDGTGEVVVFSSTADVVPPNNAAGFTNLYSYRRSDNSLRQHTFITESPGVDTTLVRRQLSLNGEIAQFASSADLAGANEPLYDQPYLIHLPSNQISQSWPLDENELEGLREGSSDMSLQTFVSEANLVGSGNTQEALQIFALRQGEIVQVTQFAADGENLQPLVSGDGCTIAFRSQRQVIAAPDGDEIYLATDTACKTTWQATGSGDWFASENWFPEVVPDDSRRVIVNNGGEVTNSLDVIEADQLIVGDSTFGGDGTANFNGANVILERGLGIAAPRSLVMPPLGNVSVDASFEHEGGDFIQVGNSPDLTFLMASAQAGLGRDITLNASANITDVNGVLLEDMVLSELRFTPLFALGDTQAQLTSTLQISDIEQLVIENELRMSVFSTGPALPTADINLRSSLDIRNVENSIADSESIIIAGVDSFDLEDTMQGKLNAQASANFENVDTLTTEEAFDIGAIQRLGFVSGEIMVNGEARLENIDNLSVTDGSFNVGDIFSGGDGGFIGAATATGSLNLDNALLIELDSDLQVGRMSMFISSDDSLAGTAEAIGQAEIRNVQRMLVDDDIEVGRASGVSRNSSASLEGSYRADGELLLADIAELDIDDEFDIGGMAAGEETGAAGTNTATYRTNGSVTLRSVNATVGTITRVGFVDVDASFNAPSNGPQPTVEPSSTVDVEANGRLLLESSQLQSPEVLVGVVVPGNTGTAFGSLELNPSLIIADTMTVGPNGSVILNIEGENRVTPATVGQPDTFAAIDAQTLNLEGEILLQFNYTPAAGTHRFSFVQATNINIAPNARIEVVGLNPGFDIDALGSVPLAGGGFQLLLQFSGAPAFNIPTLSKPSLILIALVLVSLAGIRFRQRV